VEALLWAASLPEVQVDSLSEVSDQAVLDETARRGSDPSLEAACQEVLQLEVLGVLSLALQGRRGVEVRDRT
jgi:hypothetical protein